MSRIGRLPVAVPSGVQVNVQGSDVHVKGPKGELKRSFSSQLEIAVEDGLVDAVMQAIEDSAKTGHIGDGKIFVLPLDNVVKIRTGEAGEAAL